MKKAISVFLCIVLLLVMVPTAVIPVSAAEDWLWPTYGQYAMSRGYFEGHYGIDVAVPLGTEVHATKSGTVILSYNTCPHINYETGCTCNGGCGNYVKIKHDDGTYSRYLHLTQGTAIAYGTHVNQGDIIGKSGSSGDSTGPHLHFDCFNSSDVRINNNPTDPRHTYSGSHTGTGISYIYSPGGSTPPTPTDDSLSLYSYNYPTSLDVGKSFVIYGTVSSGYSNITSLTVGVYNTSGSLETGKTVYPNSKTYNIANVDAYVLFNKLSAGTHYYRITATNASGTKQLLNKSFTVVGTPVVGVVKIVECYRKVQLPARVVNVYWNPTDTSRASYFDYGPLATCPTYAEMSDGSVWYKVNVNHQGQSTQMWFKYESDMTVTKVHTYGAVQYEYDHPHYAYQVCACGQVGYTGECGTRSDCATCNPPTISGSCGANVKWSLDTKTGKLTITGTGAMYDWNGTDNRRPWYGYANAIQSVSIANGVTSIGDWAFVDCYQLMSVTIPDSVTTIGAYAFFGCKGLKNITIPNKVSSIGEGAFHSCKAMTSVSFGNGLTSISRLAFCGCKSLTSITIPNNVTTIGSGAFLGCSGLKSITIPNSVTKINGSAFSECNNLTDVYFLGTEAKWNTITIGNDNEPLKKAKVYFQGIFESGNCGDNLTWTINTVTGVLTISGTGDMEDYTSNWLTPWFDYWESFSSVVIEDGVTSIGRNAFAGLENITDISIADSVTSIGRNAFWNCMGLTKLTIPDSITSIDDLAFSSCYGLTEVHISDLDAWCGITFNDYDSNPLYYAHNLYLNDVLVTDLVIPDSVTSIGKNTFYNCTGLTSVVIPDSVTSIGRLAFGGCSGLISVVISDSVTSIDSYAFYGCTGLRYIEVSDGIMFIGEDAFTNTGYYNDASSWDGDVLYLENYLLAAKDTLSGAYTVKDGTTLIAQFGFADCQDLTSVILPESVTTINSRAFITCDNLTNITLYHGLTEIGEYAFTNCKKLTDVYFYGTEEEWNAITIGICNDPLINAKVHFIDVHTHKYVDVVTEPTCMAQGYTTHTCSCGDTYVDSYTDALGHDIIIDATVLPTCTQTGLTEGVHCYRCDYAIAQTVIPALGHDFVDGVCTRCGEDDPNYNPPTPKDPCEGYTDINRNGWYHSAADFVISRGIMGSTKTNALTFEPNTACTRSMIVSILYRLSGSPAVTYEAKFPDIKAGQWYSDAVIWAYQNGIVSGYGDGKFGPNDKITREQMAVILKGYADFKGIDTSKIADLSDFPDANKVTWSKAAVRWAVAEGLISGKSNNGKTILDPQGNATRTEVASILMRFIQNILEK